MLKVNNINLAKLKMLKLRGDVLLNQKGYYMAHSNLLMKNTLVSYGIFVAYVYSGSCNN